jgi:hypothetical protein
MLRIEVQAVGNGAAGEESICRWCKHKSIWAAEVASFEPPRYFVEVSDTYIDEGTYLQIHGREGMAERALDRQVRYITSLPKSGEVTARGSLSE